MDRVSSSEEPTAKISSIFIYPIKSCRGISVSQAPISPTGNSSPAHSFPSSIFHDFFWSISSVFVSLTCFLNHIFQFSFLGLLCFSFFFLSIHQFACWIFKFVSFTQMQKLFLDWSKTQIVYDVYFDGLFFLGNTFWSMFEPFCIVKHHKWVCFMAFSWELLADSFSVFIHAGQTMTFGWHLYYFFSFSFYSFFLKYEYVLICVKSEMKNKNRYLEF